MSEDNKPNLKPHHGQHSDKQAGKRGLLTSFIIFMAWVAGLGLLIGSLLSLVACKPASVKQIASDDNNGYYIDLSRLTSGQASRDILAFFMPDTSAASQAVTIRSSIAPQAYSSATRGQTIISIANHLLTDYDGLTLQNKIAERRICKAVTTNTESKTRHPILLPYSVAFTQKTLGGYHA